MLAPMLYDRLPDTATPPTTDTPLDMEIVETSAAKQTEVAVHAQRLPPPEEQVYLEQTEPDPLSDLLDRVEATGDMQAFWAVAERFRPELLKIATSLTRRFRGWLRTEPEDIVNDVILRVASRLHGLNESGEGASLRPEISYFVSSIRSVIADAAKAKRTQNEDLRGGLVVLTPQDGLYDLADLMIDSDPTPDEIHLEIERRKHAASIAEVLLGAVTPRQRVAIEYTYMAANDPQGAKVLFDKLRSEFGWTGDTLKSAAFRGRQAIRRVLERGEIELPKY